MSGNQIGTIIGGVVGYFVPVIGPALGMSLGGAAGSILMPDEVGIQDQEGPRLNNLKVTSSTYGKPITKVFGANRIGGNTIWAQPIKETITVTEEEVGKGGSEDYEVTTYTYSIDMAVAFCEGPVSSMNKIWADSVLIFDADQGGYTQAFLSTEFASGQITRYLGDSTQDPNWVMQTINPDSPAYRNTCYIMFHNFQLEKFGNRVPNITCEIVKAQGEISNIVWQEEFFKSPHSVRGYLHATTPSSFYWLAMGEFDNNIRKEITCFDIDDFGIATKRWEDDLFPEGTPYIVPLHYKTGDESFCCYYDAIVGGTKNTFMFYDGSRRTITIGQEVTGNSAYMIHKRVLYIFFRETTAPELDYLAGNLYSADLEGVFFNGSGAVLDIVEDDPYFVPPFPFNDIYTMDIIDGVMYYLTNHGTYGTMYMFDLYSKALIKTIAFPVYVYLISYGNSGGCSVYPTSNSYIVGVSLFIEIDLDGNYIRSIPATVLFDDGYIYSTLATSIPKNTFIENGILTSIRHNRTTSPDPSNPGYVGTGAYVTAWNLNSGGTVTLSSIVQELCLSSGLTLSELELSGGYDTNVTGFSIDNNMTARSAIAELQSVYLFDVYEDDFKIKIRLRGDTPTRTIDSYEIKNNKETFETIKKLDTELPKKITLKYASTAIDYQQGAQSTTRIDGNSDNNITIETAIVIDDTEAKQLVEKLMYSTWSGKTTIAFTVPFDNTLKVTDVIYVSHENLIYSCRITSVIYESNKLKCIATLEEGGLYISDAVGDATNSGFNQSVSDKTSQARMVVFNGPTLSNLKLDDLGIYIATTGKTEATWRGCEIYKSVNSTEYNTQGVIFPAMKIGSTNDILGDHNSTTWDLTNTANIKLETDDHILESSTQEQLLINSANYIMIGSECLQYLNATEELDGTYTLDTLLRGRRGTEWATDTHSQYDDFIFLTSDLMFNPSTYNANRYYKAVAFGYNLDNTYPIEKVYDASNLKPFSPSMLEVSGNTITWMRRDRYVSANFRTTPLPNSELQEKYKIEFFYLDVSQGFEEVVDTTLYTYNPITYPNVDKIQVSQYSDNILDYGYIAEILV